MNCVSVIGATVALGIGAASFASNGGNWDSGTGIWDCGRDWGAGRNEASKDIAESPAAIAERPKKTNDK